MSGFHRGPFKFLPKGFLFGKTEEAKLQEAIDKFEKLHINDYDNYNEKDRELISKIMQFLHSEKFLNSSLGKNIEFIFSNHSNNYDNHYHEVPYENLKSEDLIGKELEINAEKNIQYENYLDVFKGFKNGIPEEVKQKIAEDAYVFGVAQDEPTLTYTLETLKNDLVQQNSHGIIPFIASQMDSLQKKVQAGKISEVEKKGGKRGKKTRKGRKSKKARKSHKKRNKSHMKKQ
jgi:hypothetical protein